MGSSTIYNGITMGMARSFRADEGGLHSLAMCLLLPGLLCCGLLHSSLGLSVYICRGSSQHSAKAAPTEHKTALATTNRFKTGGDDAREVESRLLKEYNFPLNAAQNGCVRDVLVPMGRGQQYCRAHDDERFPVKNEDTFKMAATIRRLAGGS